MAVVTAARLTRAERLAQIQALLAQGLTSREVAAHLDIAYSTVRNAIHDPDGAKQRERRKRYQGRCERCGGATDGSNGRAVAPKHCAPCAALEQHENRHWTPETILAAFRRYHDEHGIQPSAQEGPYNRPGPWFPNVPTVIREFGSWSAAIRAAGFIPWTKRNRGTKGGHAMYVILRQNGDGGFHSVAQVETANRERALRDYLASLPESEREAVYVTVPGSQWHPRRVSLRMQPVLQFEAVEGAS